MVKEDKKIAFDKRSDKSLTKAVIFFGFALIIVMIDQLAKFLIRANLGINEKKEVIPYFFNLWHIQNTGAGFGIFKDFTVYLIWISVIAIGIILYYYPKIIRERKILVLRSFILGGTIGNLIDRIRLGFVTDLFDFYIGNAHFATFNLADAFISVSAVLLMIFLWRK